MSIDALIKDVEQFRSHVRQFALDPNVTVDLDSKRRQLLKNCDLVRLSLYENTGQMLRDAKAK